MVDLLFPGTRAIVAVIAGGRVHKRSDLDAMLIGVTGQTAVRVRDVKERSEIAAWLD